MIHIDDIDRIPTSGINFPGNRMNPLKKGSERNQINIITHFHNFSPEQFYKSVNMRESKPHIFLLLFLNQIKYENNDIIAKDISTHKKHFKLYFIVKNMRV